MSTNDTRNTRSFGHWGLVSLFAVALSGALVGVACDSESNAVKEPQAQPSTTTTSTGNNPGTTPDGGPAVDDAGPTDCIQNPQTHDEIINACTDAVKIAKNPQLPLQYPDGGLPTPP